MFPDSGPKATILGSYRDVETGARVLRAVKRSGFHRSVALTYLRPGRTRLMADDLLAWRFAVLGACAGAIIAALYLAFGFAPAPVTGRHLLLAAGLVLAGALLGYATDRLRDFVVTRGLIATYKRWLLPQETLVVVQVPVERARTVLTLLRRVERGQPATFVIRSMRPVPRRAGESLSGERFTTERLRFHATSLASRQRPASQLRGTYPLRSRARHGQMVVEAVNADLMDGASLGQNVSTAAEWLLDNSYIVQRHIIDVLDNLSEGFYDVLPVLEDGGRTEDTRVHELAVELVAHTDSEIHEQDVVAFLEAYQEVMPLTIAELWAMPLMLRLALVENLSYLAIQVDQRQHEHEMADLWANRLLSAARRAPDALLTLMVELAQEPRVAPAYFAERLVSQLQGEPAALEPVRAWLERKWDMPVAEVIQEEQNRQAAIQVTIASTIGSLRRLSQMDWRETFERVSLVDRVLRTDPAGVYPEMDFDTRNRYRRNIELIARRSQATELDLARSAVGAAAAAQPGDRRGHVGYFLVDAGRAELEANARYRQPSPEKARAWALRNAALVYVGGIGVLAVVVLALALRLGTNRVDAHVVAIALLALLPASEIAVQIVNYLVTLLLRPRVLPKLSFEDGIPDEWRTIVVVPMLLQAAAGIQSDVNRLETRYLANPDPNLRFALLADFPDALEPMTAEDESLLQTAITGIADLNGRYGGNRFSLFYRTRVWSKSEQRWMGWERKRGKLEELNRWLLWNNSADADSATAQGTMRHIGDSAQLRGVRFVITLDSDTQLPLGVAHRLVGTLAHPLNRPVLSPDFRRVEEGYTIIQPRVSTSLPSATATRFSRLFTDAAGIDPYTHAVSDVYQDLTGEASYHGKAIYDLEMFHHVLNEHFPDELLLSHDLIEGAHVRTGLASDIELLDEFPSSYVEYTSREHRWIRGDWQITDWVFPSVPARDGGRVLNPLDPMNRWKIFDNLRRSVVPVGSVLLLVVAWLYSSGADWTWDLLVALAMFLPALIGLPAWIASQPLAALARPETWRDTRRSLTRAVLATAFLPHQAALNLDAIVRAFSRRLVSRRRLLEWRTAQMAQDAASEQEHRFVWRVWLVSLFALVLAGMLAAVDPGALPIALPYLVLWLLFPVIVDWLRGGRRPKLIDSISASDRFLLRRIARRTWGYFDEFVGRASNWLPPDNYQAALRVEVAQRTSPTNIGLWLISSTAAHDFGYITLDQLIQRHSSTMETLGKLETFQGHLLNWYDTRTLQPLHPRYVSTVDSGNLLACLWNLVEGYRDSLARPIFGRTAFQGLADTFALALVHERTMSELPSGEDAGRISFLISSLSGLFGEPPDRLDGQVQSIRTAAAMAAELSASLRTGLTTWSIRNEGGNGSGNLSQDRNEAAEDAVYWIGQVERQLARWVEIVERYLPWVERLATMPSTYLASLGASGSLWRDQALAEAPSLQALGTGKHRPLAEFLAAAERTEGMSDELRQWLRDLRDSASYAQWLAGEMLASAGRIVSQADDLVDKMDMRFLYDEERKLFTIGYNVSERRLDGSYYDLLASEARLASYIAVARDEVPADHWFALGRPYGMAGGRRVLLSWSGTMFEYLMPLLFNRSFENSLLDSACHAAVAWQIEYARQRGIPWGMSEAAFAALDAHRIYQYQAFGVPGLGLKRGLEDDLVIAPYASALALMVDPKAALANLKMLTRLGATGRYGYYDAVDYTRRRRAEAESGVIVYTYMVHHQGMIMLALHNVLNDWVIQKRFHADARARATEPLLYERIPLAPPIITGPTRGEAPPRLPPPSAVEVTRGFTTPDSPTPRTQLLGTESYSVMITNSGGGYSRWRDFDISRWRADTTLDCWGNFIYIKDVDQGIAWSATHHPVKRPTSRYLVNFGSNRAQFERRDLEIGTVTDVVVSVEDDAEVHRLTLVNYSNSVRHLEVTSYVELALAPRNADRAHPAFSKMFVETEALDDQDALLAWRKRRSPDDPEIWAVHVLASVASGEGGREIEYETDRARFIGRGRTLEDPAALEGELSGSTGPVLDPIFSLRRSVTLDPGARVQLAFVTAAAANRESALALAEKFGDLRASHRTFDLAESQATLVARHLRVSPEDLQRYQQLASHMLYPNPRFRAPASMLRRNRLGQSGLWAYGISGDLPILLVTIGDQRDMPLVRDALLAHTYWRLKGFKADLVILDEEAAGYEQPLRDNLRRLVQSHTQYTGTEQPGGVFLRAAKQIPSGDLALLMAVARIVLVAARGDLARQLTSAPEAPRAPVALSTRRQHEEEPSNPLPFMELPYFNGSGGFTPDGREYAVYLGPGAETPAPWVNVMANPTFGAMVSESGAGFSWYGNSQSNRLLPWSNDSVTDPIGDAIYIRDEQLGIFWSPTPSPVRELDAYRARHGQGYTVFEHNSHAIEQELTVFVPADQSGGLPVKVQRLRLRNRSSYRRTLRVTYFAEWVLGQSRDETQMHVVTGWDVDRGVLLARNSYHPDYSGRVAFVASSLKPSSFTADRTEFLGRNGGTSRPAALGRQSLSGRYGAGLDPCAALQVVIEMDPGRDAEVTFVLGEAADVAEARTLAARFREPDRVEESLQQTRGWWDRLLGAVQVETPILSVNFLLNRWLLYQALSCRVWGRSAFYQSGGAIGFRDQLQDCLSLVYAIPAISRTQILTATAHQFVEGDVQHWWHPEAGAGVRTRISDDLLWLPFAVAQYVRVTGDRSVMDEAVPFLVGPVLKPDEHEAYFAPAVSQETGSVLEHCRRSIRKGLTSGPHGLPLIGTGDWNDGMNRVGAEGKGESVWLAWFLVKVLDDFAWLLDQHGEPEEAEKWRAKARELTGTVEKTAWDGDWYLRAYFDDGSPLGSRSNVEARIDSIAQSWGVISGAADPTRARRAMSSAEEQLVRKGDKLSLLFTPPFSSVDERAAMGLPDPGYIAGYPRGVRENGGQYTHGALWLAMAFARMGEGGKAVELLNILNPVEHARTPEDVARYRTEPYVVAADVYALDGRVGQGGWTWYTGSAGWMYRVWIEEVLGVRLRGNRLSLDPAIPADWEGFRIRWRFGSAEYLIAVENPGGVGRGIAWIEVDGKRLAGDAIDLVDDGVSHSVTVRLGSAVAGAGRTSNAGRG